MWCLGAHFFTRGRLRVKCGRELVSNLGKRENIFSFFPSKSYRQPPRKKMDLLENIHWFCLEKDSKRSLFVGKSICNGGLQKKWFLYFFFEKNLCTLWYASNFESKVRNIILLIWNHEGHVVALESNWKFVEQFRPNLRTYWRNHRYTNDPLFLCVMVDPDFWYRKYFQFYSKMHFTNI